jgi:lipopolysaccharide biosynthesis glycosyltransferase
MARRIYVGWDSREDIAYQVCKHSIHKHADAIDVKPLKLHELKDQGLVTRPDDAKASTQFTFTRFLVPHLNHYRGWALFIDCDFLFRSDVNKLFDLADPSKAVMVAKHEYHVSDGTAKMDGQVQHAYPRKNWSSCILFNCEHPSNRSLTPADINGREMSYLHRFSWLQDDEIGEIPHSWNWLVGHYHEPKDGRPDAIHYTLGGPWFKEHQDVEYGSLWTQARDEYYKSW